METVKAVWSSRKFRKGALEAVGACALALLGLLSEEPEIVAGTSGAGWIIRQAQRTLRDGLMGQPD